MSALRHGNFGQRMEDRGAQLALLVNAEAEQILLGALMICNRCYARVTEIIDEQKFGNALHGRIFVAIGQLITKGTAANPVTLKNYFDQDDTLRDVGGGQYLARLAAAASVIDTVEDYAREVAELASRRDLIAACEQAIDDAYTIELGRPAAGVVRQHAMRVADLERLAPRASGSIDLRALDLDHWLTRDIRPPEYLLGEVWSTTSRCLIVGDTGLGKSNLLLGMGIAKAAGASFLHWQGAGAPKRILYVDGEMSERLLRARLEDAVRRFGQQPATFHPMNRFDFPDMPPLNTEEGGKFIDAVIDAIQGADEIIFDNVQALTAGDQKDEVSWNGVLPWVRSLTLRKVGQIWAHHTGHGNTRSYGTKTREWQMDTVILMEPVERPSADIAFSFKFTKARERRPDNRADFEPAIITLANDTWTSERSGLPEKKARNAKSLAFDLLAEAVAEHGEIPPAHRKIPPDTRCINEELWARIFKTNYVSNGKPDAFRMAFSRAANSLILEQKVVGKHGEWVWPLR